MSRLLQLLFLVCLLVGACFVGLVSANFTVYYPPELTVMSPVEGGVYNCNVPLVLNITITPKLTGWEKILDLSYSLDGSSEVALPFPDKDIDSNNYVTGVLYGLSDGFHTLFVSGLTSYKNAFNSTVNFSVKAKPVDSIPLKIVPLAPTNTTYLGGTALRLNFWVNKPILWAQYSLNGAENASIIANTTVLSCNLGSNCLTVYAADEDGNVAASETVTFTVVTFSYSKYDKIYPSPLLPIISVDEPQNVTYNQSSAPLTFTLNQPVILDPSIYTFTLNNLTFSFPDVSWVGYSLDGQTNKTVTSNTTLWGLTSGTHNLTVYAEDIYGNTGSSAAIYFTINPPFPTAAVIGISTAVLIVSAVSIVYLKKRKPAYTETVHQ